ncbi:hypothetical protein HMPREF9589_01134 [Cutibacterium acnes HL059PA1]|nr:hypothetical protein PAZ_c10870 [Cutibacterium acnes 266]EFS43153.1 hypothetical protein HMPREF9576_01711 [Cutibacterium acnes HL110PA2]EFS53695.1 hypothetical protein HMPREF9589_01134 [Cutibacterium acnes HL059PA1]EFS76459.1 hypothetical protein HMPREF9591_01848 [Cutibacterium acnes HL086PA1]
MLAMPNPLTQQTRPDWLLEESDPICSASTGSSSKYNVTTHVNRVAEG